MNKVKVFFLLAALMLMSISAQAQEETELKEVKFFLSYIPNIQFAPIYVAIEKGYFEEEGIELVIEHGDENLGVEQIALGDIPFGMISGEQVILARANERPVVYVYEWFQAYPIAIVIPDTTEATTMTELTDRRVGVPGRFGATYSGLTALLSANDMTEDNIQLEEVGFNAPDVICAGAVDASTVYINNEPLEIQRRADAGECGDITSVTVIPVAETANMISNGIVTNEALIADDPDLVRSVVRAFDRGLEDTINNPAEAYLLSEAHVENLPLSDDLRAYLEESSTMATPEPIELESADTAQYEVLLATIPLWDAERLGVNNPDGWVLTQEVLLQMGSLSDPIALEDAYTDEFLPETDSAE